MRRLNSVLLLVALVGAGVLWQQHGTGPVGAAATDTARDRTAWLPPEAAATLAAITRGGPFAYRQDGAVFGNYEHRLPLQPRGYYREYTVPTPATRNRGARRIITGGTPPAVYCYTDDHYRSFHRFEGHP